MWKKILVGFLVVVIALTLGGYLYYRLAIYQPPAISAEDRAAVDLMPLPAKLRLTDGMLQLNGLVQVEFAGHREARLDRAVDRFLQRLETQGASPVKRGDDGPKLFIDCEQGSSEPQQVEEQEGYSLAVNGDGIRLKASSAYGILHGLETLAQLLKEEEGAFFFPFVDIEDAPRFPWRGLMIDVCRHWMPKEVILRNLDAMAALKMNVLHLHLTEYQGFRIESKTFPKLHELGSNGNYYTQKDVREIIAYAADRGIRVVPEFDLPGHSTSWFVGYPELASAPGPYTLDERFGVLTPVMDPTREEVYEFLDEFMAEMATLFPDPYIHIGGDEVEPHDWENNADIQAFMKEEGISDYHELQAYFNQRVEEILQKYGKRMIGWDEILHPDLSDRIIVQSWRSQKSLFEAVRSGGRAILSAGYYLDHKLPAARHYEVDPEIMPGAVDMVIDSNEWRTWALTVDAMGTTINSSLTLFGPRDQLRGVMGMGGNYSAIPSASWEGDQLRFSFQSDYGEIKFEGTTGADSLAGELRLGIMRFSAAGPRVAGDDIAGTSLPKIEPVKPLTEAEKEQVLGGEACMWSEVVDARTVDSRIWPRAAAIAERLWSPREVANNVEDMYRRMDAIDRYLEDLGLQHRAYRPPLVKDIAGEEQAGAVETLIEVLEEVKYYDRMGIYDTLTTRTPLNRLVDAAAPESRLAREFAGKVDAFLMTPEAAPFEEEIRRQLDQWATLADRLGDPAGATDRFRETILVARKLQAAAQTGREALNALLADQTLPEARRIEMLEILESAAEPEAGVLVAVVPPIRRLVEATEKSQGGSHGGVGERGAVQK